MAVLSVNLAVHSDLPGNPDNAGNNNRQILPGLGFPTTSFVTILNIRCSLNDYNEIYLRL